MSKSGGFEAFWKAYPKKRNKTHAHRVWCRIKPDEALQARINFKVREYMDAGQWVRGGQFVPYPATWLGRGGWEDEVYVPEHQRRQQRQPGKLERAKIAYLDSRRQG